MATATIYASAGDGEIRHGSNTSWATMRNASTGTSSDNTSTQLFGCYAGNNAGDATTYAGARGYLPFDLSSISGTITAIDLNIKPYAEWHGAAGSLAVCSSTQASLTALATSDWGNAGTTEYVTSRPAFSSFTAGTYKTLTINATGVAAATTGAGGKLLIALRASYDLDNSAPSNGTYGGLGLDYSERSGTSDDPYLTVTYTPSPSVTYTADAIVAYRVQDSFTDTNGTDLGSHTPTGPLNDGTWTGWYQPSGCTLKVTSNRVYCAYPSAGSVSSGFRHSYQLADGMIAADLSIPGSHNDGGYAILALRHSGATPGASSAYRIAFSNGGYGTAGTVSLYKLVSGSDTQLGSTYTIGTLSSSATYRVSLELLGTALTVKLNGTSIITATDSAITASGYAEIELNTPDGRSSSNGVQIDNFMLGTPPNVTTATYTADAIIGGARVTQTYTADAIVLDISTSKVYSADAIIKATATQTYTADAVVAPTRVTQTYTADGIVNGTSYGTQGTRTVNAAPIALFPSDGNTNAYGAHYAMPDGITLADGTEIAVCRKATYHASLDGSIVLKKRPPGGSWSSEYTILNTSYDERDPSLGLLANGDLCLTWNRQVSDSPDYHYYAPFMKCAAGSDPAVAANWSTPVNITGTGIANNWRVGTDILELTPGGRILVALYGTPTYPPWVQNECWIAYSDDAGATWAMLSQLDSGAAHSLHSSGEAQLAACSDGSILAVYRTVASPWEAWARRSTDSGATWSSEWRVATNAINKVGMIVTPDGDHIICYGNGSTLNFSQSWDRGNTFGTVTNTGYAANIYCQPFFIARAGVTPNVGIIYGNETGSQYGPNNYSSVYYVELTRSGAAYVQRAATYTADAVISASGASAATKTYTADAVVSVPPYSKTYTADGIVKGLGLTLAYGADAVVVDSASQSTALSWFFRRRRSSMSLQTKTYTVVQAKGTARTATWTSPTYKAETEAGILVVLDVTAASGTGGLTLRVNAHDLAGSVEVPLNSAPTAVSATGTTSYAIYPFGAISGALTQSTSGYLPRMFSITVTHGDSSSYTYSVGYCLLP